MYIHDVIFCTPTLWKKVETRRHL